MHARVTGVASQWQEDLLEKCKMEEWRGRLRTPSRLRYSFHGLRDKCIAVEILILRPDSKTGDLTLA